jgi:hypothetical protein
LISFIDTELFQATEYCYLQQDGDIPTNISSPQDFAALLLFLSLDTHTDPETARSYLK